MCDFQEVQRHVAQLPVWGEWLPSARKGATGIGKTFENVIGVVENNLQEADFQGVEFKAKRSESGALITMFTLNPTAPVRAVHELVGAYGYAPDERGWKRFNTNFAVGRLTSFGDHTLTLGVGNSGDVNVIADGETVATWTRAAIEVVLAKKSATLALLDADSREGDQGEEFRLRGCSFYWNLAYERFCSLISDGKISVHFRVKGNAQKARNRGCAFRIEKSTLTSLYLNHIVLKNEIDNESL